ncbi:Stf0 family sulfotransferase [Pontibacter actiniarum]|uniref:Sulphotransferase Stf0 domain-containing protein n=1 Tax=Pontibacter actiniarum TaxID=323450 RepID=A0A1X9YWC0_9BACT|nr:Stf0 family sulfotransferase [Pontibacter actiniarum]ARS37159.1 hypothetical protein CA264_17945 [Pontibacter actiniarum]
MYNYLLHLRTYLIIKRKQLSNAVSRQKGRGYTPFAILCEPRTGSTLLHTYLNFHPQVMSYGEVLREKRVAGLYTSPQPVSAYVFKPHSPQIKAVGLKLFYSYLQDPFYQSAFDEVMQRKDVRIIHLVRKDLLKQYVSLEIAKKTKVWSADRAHVKPEREKMHIDCEDLTRFLDLYMQNQNYLKGLFQQHEVLSIAYEGLSERPSEVLEEVQRFLGVQPRTLLSLLQKQSSRPLESFITNYDEARRTVEKVLNGSL